MKTLTMNISKALTYKKRLAGQLAKIQGEIQTYNTVVVGKISEDDESKTLKEAQPNRMGYDVVDLLDTRELIKKSLIELKLGLFNASSPIREKILKLAELKSDSVFFSQISNSAKDGLVFDHYGDSATKYHSVMTKEEAEKRVKQISQQIDQIQGEIDEFNYTTKIEVSDIGI